MENHDNTDLILNQDYCDHYTATYLAEEPKMDETLVSVAVNDDSELCILQVDDNKYVVSIYDDELKWIHGKKLIVRNKRFINPVAFYWKDNLYIRFFDAGNDVNIMIDYVFSENVYVLSGADFVDIANIALQDRPAINISTQSKYKLHEFRSKKMVFLDEDQNELVLYDYSQEDKMERIGGKIKYFIKHVIWLSLLAFNFFWITPRRYKKWLDRR